MYAHHFYVKHFSHRFNWISDSLAANIETVDKRKMNE